MTADAETGLTGLGWGGASSGRPRVENDARYWGRLAADRARALPDGPLGGVVAQLRARARKADRRAGWFLGALMLTILGGFAYYVGWPLFTQIVDGTRQTWEAQIEAAEADGTALDARRGEAMQLLADLLELAPRVTRPGDGDGLQPPVALADGTLITTGWDGTILRSGDGGRSWAEVRVGSADGEGLYPPVALADGTLIATGEFGKILRSEDGGGSWAEVRAADGERLFPPIARADGSLIATGEFGKILRSEDGGRSWTEARAVEGERISDLIALADGSLIATGPRGTILRLEEGGRMWAEVRAEDGEGLFPPVALEDGTVVATGEFGKILRSTDGGRTWAEARAADGEGLYPPVTLVDGTLIATGAWGTVLLSEDGGRRWAEARAGSSEEAWFDPPVALAGGILILTTEIGEILRSEDGGQTWAERRSADGEGLSPPVALGDGNLIAIGDFGKILRSEDGGRTWAEARAATADGVGLSPPVALADGTLIATSGPTAFGMGNPGVILRLSSDDGAALAKLPVPDGRDGDMVVLAFLRGLDPGVQLTDRALAARSILEDEIAPKREVVDAARARAEQKLADWGSGAAQSEARRAAFAAFMESCRAGAQEPDDAAMTTACLAAYSASEAETRRQWWQALAEQAPPGILILFLLATLSGLYRYSVRMAGFYDGRADALELLAAGAAEGRLTPLADALAADKVEFGAAKMPTDHAAEMATALINRARPA